MCNWLWAYSRAGDVLDETMQRNAVLAVAHLQDPIDLAVRSLTAAQATVQRWILMHPGASPFAREATAAMDLNAGTVNSATNALMEAELIELFARNRFTATTPLRLLATVFLADALDVTIEQEIRAVILYEPTDKRRIKCHEHASEHVPPADLLLEPICFRHRSRVRRHADFAETHSRCFRTVMRHP